MVMYRKERTLMTTASSLNSAACIVVACHTAAAACHIVAAYRTAGTAAFHTACCSSDLSSAVAVRTAAACTAGAVACTVAVRTAAVCTAAAGAAGRH